MWCNHKCFQIAIVQHFSTEPLSFILWGLFHKDSQVEVSSPMIRCLSIFSFPGMLFNYVIVLHKSLLKSWLLIFLHFFSRHLLSWTMKMVIFTPQVCNFCIIRLTVVVVMDSSRKENAVQPFRWSLYDFKKVALVSMHTFSLLTIWILKYYPICYGIHTKIIQLFSWFTIFWVACCCQIHIISVQYKCTKTTCACRFWDFQIHIMCFNFLVILDCCRI